LLTIINDILDFSKIESGQLELERHPFELRACVEEVLDLLGPKAAEKKVDLAYNVDDSIPKVLVSDVTRLRQILVNLVSNSVKFTHQGEVVVEVAPTARGKRTLPPGQTPDTDFLRHPDQWVLHFSIRDTGIGIPRDKQHRLFKSFQQVDASTTRHYGGTGLGLAICRRLTDLLGGRIWVESDSGKGATFHFTIVVRASAAVALPGWQAVQPQLTGKRLLVVEDNPTNCRIIKQRGEQWGMHIESVGNSVDALQHLARSQPFDAVLLDQQLPDKGGLAMVEEIRRQPYGRYLPILLLSSARPRVDGSHPAPPGVSVFLHKPIHPEQLLDALCRALGVQVQQEKKSPVAPALDSTLAQRLPLRILMADDNPINQKVGLSVLQKLGYRADVASNGTEVLKALEQTAYDILFLDVQMPEIDGLEAARQICRRWPEDQRPRMIAMTGNALLGDREKCLEAGMDDYISKPIRVVEMQEAVEHWGSLRPPRTDTAFLWRSQKQIPVENLLDQKIINELGQMAPHDGTPVLNQLIDVFLDQAPRHIADVNQSINDPLKLANYAQALKSVSLNLCARRMAEISEKLEEMGTAGIVIGAPSLLRELDAAFHQTRAHLVPLREK
ncbi:MAG TPA: response regulator, partial [Verrucomicrobiae bacterium]|nr:response regulator [Verrucomicrobiae bacterium]